MLAIRDDANKTTDVLVTKAGKGWTYELLPGSAPVQDVRTAAKAPKLGIAAHLVRTGKRAKLDWSLSHVNGRTVSFMESGPGAPPRVLAKHTAKDGSVTYKPFITPERDRTIVAIVEKDGMPISRQVVAHVTQRTGRRTLQTVKQHRITLKAATTRKVTVRTIGADGRVGPAESVKPRKG